MAIIKKPASPLPPTTQAYHELQLAYEFFKELFPVDMPPAFITIQRRSARSFGYFSAGRFATARGVTADEIGLNLKTFRKRSFIEIMSTLVHEMVHQWQHHFGRRRSLSAYHNKEFAGEMLRIGLHPSHTGKPGGRMTGQQMSHYIIPGGPFEISANKLRRMLPDLTWFDAEPGTRPPEGPEGFEPDSRLTASGRRTVYRCPNPHCKDRAEGSSTLFLICGKCELQMEPVGYR